MIYAISKMELTGTPFKAIVLRYLPEQDQLIEAVIRNHWEAHTKTIPLELILHGSPHGFIQDKWITAPASIRDPLT